MEQLQRICNDLKDINEIAIIERYGSHAKRYTVVFTCKIIFFYLYYTLIKEFVIKKNFRVIYINCHI